MMIKELTLCTKDITSQKEFYTSVIGLKITEDKENLISFKIGNSILRFVKRKNAHPYHFAFTIPANKTEEALKWLKTKVKILKDGNDEIIDFPAWNANSIYFYDSDKNILEFIARKNLDNHSTADFTSESLLEISEIGIPTEDFSAKYDFLTNEVGLAKYSGGTDTFCAIGSEEGLFILIDKNRKDWFPLNDKAFTADFKVRIENKGEMHTIEYTNEVLLKN